MSLGEKAKSATYSSPKFTSTSIPLPPKDRGGWPKLDSLSVIVNWASAGFTSTVIRKTELRYCEKLSLRSSWFLCSRKNHEGGFGLDRQTSVYLSLVATSNLMQVDYSFWIPNWNVRHIRLEGSNKQMLVNRDVWFCLEHFPWSRFDLEFFRDNFKNKGD